MVVGNYIHTTKYITLKQNDITKNPQNLYKYMKIQLYFAKKRAKSKIGE